MFYLHNQSYTCRLPQKQNLKIAGVALVHVDQLQSVVNAGARLIGGIPKLGHISEFIRAELHWLPMHRRIAFKILMLMRNCLAGQAPVYLRELCVPVSSLPG